jgi:UDP-N-acetylmuramoylalanine--D-glutamate ligase
LLQVQHKHVLIIGLGNSGLAAAQLLRERGAKVLAADSADTFELQRHAAQLKLLGIDVKLGADRPSPEAFDLVVVSPGVPWSNPILAEMHRRNVPIIGEFELGYRYSRCLNISVTGTNGKTTTTELIERLLRHHRIKTVAAGNIGTPVCAVVERTKDLDFLTLEVSSFQLETIQCFRPAIAVLLNITPDHLDRYASMADYARAKARLFMNQQQFDWAIIQCEALEQLKALDLRIPAKLVTFSASHREADLYLDRGLIISALEGWSGPLLDLATCRLIGPHNAENLMAVLAVGRVLRVPLESMVETLKSYEPAAHRCEAVAEINGVKFINDSKATNLDAVHKALLAVPAGRGGEPNVWLIAGGKDKGFEYHDIGPLLSRRVKGAFLIGASREKIRSAWSLFTPCTLADSLVEAVTEAAHNAVAGDVVLLSPACSSFDQFQNYQHRGEVFRQAVRHLQKPAESEIPDRANRPRASALSGTTD